ncbi:type IV secretion system DNA-binding domain-containing protein [Burkholderia gladioli]|uniref:type IV secretion system DNA-binding domain-containing protein n=1 Tax=Burkholderia gladioli TaxID=28095 RepID=UPI001FC9AB48|nr:type IV secretion system DNA-binding domain-containing protein [Burkholderia gladioli]
MTEQRRVPLRAPSAARVDWAGWLAISALEGAAAGGAAIVALWRWLPLWGAPVGALRDHARLLTESAVHLAAPAFFSSAWPAYAQMWASLAPDSKSGMVARALVSCAVAAAPALLNARSRLRPSSGLLLVRGPRRHEGAAASRALRKRFAKQCRRWPDHPLAPNVPFPADMWTRHVLAVGGTGSGKTTFIKPLLREIEAARERVIVFDPKGEFTAQLANAAILAPWDARSVAWDIAVDLKNAQHMRGFAAAIVSDSQDPMWSNAARQLLCGLLFHLRKTRGRDWGWRDLAELVSLSQPALLAIMRDCYPEAVRVVEQASVTTQGVLINLSSFCSSIHDLAAAWGDIPKERRVSLRRWAMGRSRHRQIVIQGHGAYEELTKKYVSAAIGVVSATVNSVEMDDDQNRKLWLVADELPQMGRVPIRALFAVGRSRGVRCVVAFQDFAQLEEIHGEPMVRALTSMCGTLVVGQMSPGDTAEKLCKSLGSREHERMNASLSTSASGESRGLSFSREVVPLYSPSELVSRLGPTADGKGVKLLVFTGGDAHEIFYPHTPVERARDAHVPAPWTFGPRAEIPEAPVGESTASDGREYEDAAGSDAGGAQCLSASDDGVAAVTDYMREMQRLVGGPS